MKIYRYKSGQTSAGPLCCFMINLYIWYKQRYT